MPDKLFQKRKLESARRAKRLQAVRSVRRRILIVCEGYETEPNYFEYFIKLDCSANVISHIPRDHNTGPMKLISQARSILSRDSDYDLAFVVSDRDRFEDFDQAIATAFQIKKPIPINFIYSDPAFELWLLYHFERTDAPMSRFEAIDRVREFMPDYEKGYKNIAVDIYDKTETAIENAKWSLQRCEETGARCPSTNVHHLIEAIR